MSISLRLPSECPWNCRPRKARVPMVPRPPPSVPSGHSSWCTNPNERGTSHHSPHARYRSAHEVQIGSADRRGRHPHDRIGRLLDSLIPNVVQTNVADAMEYDRFHVHALQVKPTHAIFAHSMKVPSIDPETAARPRSCEHSMHRYVKNRLAACQSPL